MNSSRTPASSSGSTVIVRLALDRRGDLRQLRVPGLAVDERHAEEQEPGREAAEQQVLQRRFLGALLAAREAAEHVERERQQLDRQEDDHEARRAGEQHHPDGRGEDQRVVLAVVDAPAVEVVRADHDHQPGADQQDGVDEQREAVVRERAGVHQAAGVRVEPGPDRDAERRREAEQCEAREPGALRRRDDQVEQHEQQERAAEHELGKDADEVASAGERQRNRRRGDQHHCVARDRCGGLDEAHRGAHRTLGDVGDGLGKQADEDHQRDQRHEQQSLAEVQVVHALGSRLGRVVHQALVETEHVPGGEDHAAAGEHRVDPVQLERAEHDRELADEAVHAGHAEARERGHQEEEVQPGHSPFETGQLAEVARAGARLDEADDQEERADDDAVVDHLDHRAVDAVVGQREDAERDEAEVADARVGDDAFEVAFRQRHQRAVDDAEHGERGEHEPVLLHLAGEERQREADEPVRAELADDARRRRPAPPVGMPRRGRAARCATGRSGS